LRVALLSHGEGAFASICSGLAHCFSKKGIETTIVYTTRSKPKVEKISDTIEIIYLPLINYLPRSLWFNLSNLSKLLKLFKSHTLIHSISPEMAIVYAFLGNSARRPLVTTMHMSHIAALKAFLASPSKEWKLGDFGYHVLELPLHEMIDRICLAESNRVVVCSCKTLTELEKYERIDLSKASVIYNGINLAEIDEVQVEERDVEAETGHELSMLYAGRLYYLKGITFALRAFVNLRKHYKSLQLKIFGKGPLESDIKRFIARNNLKKDVFFGGFLPHKELIKEFKKSDVVVLPSLYESQPIVALEAMACKKPFVAFNYPYAREIITDGYNGLLAKAYDVEDLSDKIGLALQDRKLRLKLGKNAYEYIRKNHDWDTQAMKYLKVYGDVIEETQTMRARKSKE